MKLFVTLALCVLNQLRAAPIKERFSSLRGQSQVIPAGTDYPADGTYNKFMEENVAQAKTLISFAANRVAYADGKTPGAEQPCITIEALEKAVPGMTKSYKLEGLAAIGKKCIACGLLNAIFFREFMMKKQKTNTFTGAPGTGGTTSKYYLDFLTMKYGSPLHTDDKWFEAWTSAVSNAKMQYFLVDDAFMRSPNCVLEVDTWNKNTAADKPKAIVIRGEAGNKFFGSTAKSNAAAVSKLFKGKHVDLGAGIFTNWIPASVKALMSSCPNI